VILGTLGGIVGGIGQLILLLGVYAYLGGAGLLLAAVGFSMICSGEAIALFQKREKEEIILLRRNILKEWAVNMAFPAIWLAFSVFGGGLIFLAFAASTGAGAMIRNLRLAATLNASS
jgi:hypothetical protein